MERYERVRLTNPDKVLYPETGTTKAEVIEYYVEIAAAMLPHVAGRPVTRKRWPNGVGRGIVLREETRVAGPGLVGRAARSRTRPAPPPTRSSTPGEGLAWLGQQAALEVHVPQWRFDGDERGPATRIVFDLDPGDGVTMRQLCEVARGGPRHGRPTSG